jgi:hypothetical protein
MKQKDIIESLKARCAANADVAKKDLARKRLTNAIDNATAEQIEKQKKMRG